METKVTAENITVTLDNGPNPDGSPGVASWSMTPEQAQKHLPMFNAGVPVVGSRNAAGAPQMAVQKMSTGEQSAVRDAAEEFRKQVAS